MIIQGNKIWMEDVFIQGQIEIQDTKIIGIYPKNHKIPDRDYEDNRIVPGFIDIHTHGANGIDTWHPNPDDFRKWMKILPKEGVTAFCPTIMTPDENLLKEALAVLHEVKKVETSGSEMLGMHIEGSCIQNGKQDDNRSAIERLKECQIANEDISIVTLAAEKDIDYELTRYCTKHGICVSLGHSTTDYPQAVMAVANGARGITHVFNGMPPINPKKPGLVQAALRLRHLYGEIIGDGKDVSLDLLYTYFMTKPDYAILVTDTIALKGTPPDTCIKLMGNEIRQATECFVNAKTGLYAGPSLGMNEQLRVIVEQAQVPWEIAIRSCTINPSRYLRIDDRKGRIAVGYDADITVLNPDYTIKEVFARGVRY